MKLKDTNFKEIVNKFTKKQKILCFSCLFASLTLLIVAFFLIANNINFLNSKTKIELSSTGHIHNFSPYLTIIREPTCEKEGIKGHLCEECDEYKDPVTIPVLEHNFMLNKTVESTCTKLGYNLYVCEMCGQKNKESLTEYKHNYKVTETIKYCEKEGYKTYTCIECGDFYTEKLAPLKHEWNTNIFREYDSNANIVFYKTCRNCDEKMYVTSSGEKTDVQTIEESHEWIEKTEKRIEPTCSTNGSKTFICANCGELRTENIPFLQHVFTEKTENPTCTIDGRKVVSCDLCGEVQSEQLLRAPGHIIEEGIISEEATCLHGNIMLYICGVCEEEIYFEDEFLLDHDYKIFKYEKDGYLVTENKCSMCGEILSSVSVPITN